MLNDLSTLAAVGFVWASLAAAQIQLPTEYPYCNVVAMQWEQGNGPYTVSIVGPSGSIYQSYETHETYAHWGVTLDEQTAFNVHWSDQSGQIIESDQYTVIAGASGCIVVDKGQWSSTCQTESTSEENGQVVTVTQTITAPTPVVTRTVCNCGDDDDDDDDNGHGQTITVTEATSSGGRLGLSGLLGSAVALLGGLALL